jgi:hypothetical protein
MIAHALRVADLLAVLLVAKDLLLLDHPALQVYLDYLALRPVRF